MDTVTNAIMHTAACEGVANIAIVPRDDGFTVACYVNHVRYTRFTPKAEDFDAQKEIADLLKSIGEHLADHAFYNDRAKILKSIRNDGY